MAFKYRKNILRSILNNRELSVVILTYGQRLFVISFSKVRSGTIHNVEGMMLYALAEMSAEPPFRRFVFVNWYEGEEEEEAESHRHWKWWRERFRVLNSPKTSYLERRSSYSGTNSLFKGLSPHDSWILKGDRREEVA